MLKKKSFFTPFEIKNISLCDTEFTIARVFCRLTEKSISRRIKKAKIKLKKDGFKDVLLYNQCKDEKLYNDCMIPEFRMVDAFEYIQDKIAKNWLIDRVDIYDKITSAETFNVLRKIILSVKEVRLHTLKTCEMHGCAEKMFSEFGVVVEVDENFENSSNKSSVIDFDLRYVRIGDFVVDGIEYEKPNYIFDEINLNRVAEDSGYDNCFKIKNWVSGKNMLEIS